MRISFAFRSWFRSTRGRGRGPGRASGASRAEPSTEPRPLAWHCAVRATCASPRGSYTRVSLQPYSVFCGHIPHHRPCPLRAWPLAQVPRAFTKTRWRSHMICVPCACSRCALPRSSAGTRVRNLWRPPRCRRRATLSDAPRALYSPPDCAEVCGHHLCCSPKPTLGLINAPQREGGRASPPRL